MCLECGRRLALDYQRPPSWRLPAAIAGIVVLLAGAGVAFALAEATHNANKTTANAPTQPVENAAPADTPPATSQPAATASTAAAPKTTTPATTGSTSTTTPAPTPAAGGWPDGKSAFTVILASLPTKAAADAKLKDAQAAGFTGAAILHSDDFPSLRPGWWVVFDGQFDTIGQANQQAANDRNGKGGFSQAYPRFVSKDANAKP